MDLRLGLSLLLLLAYASGTWSKTASRDGPSALLPRQRQSHSQQHSHHHHRHQRQLQRPARALSEFLVPPPVPSSFRNSRGPPPPPAIAHHQSTPGLSPPPPPPPPAAPGGAKHVRNGRYVSQGNLGTNGGPGYFSKLANWLNPFDGGAADKSVAPTKDNHSQAASNQPRLPQQYAPHQPYTGGTSQVEPTAQATNQQNSFSNLAAWMSGRSCNPCNEVPWTPVLRQYASNAGGNAYLPPPSHPPPQDIKLPPLGPPIDNSQHLGYPEISPPLYDAKPFHTGAADFSPPHFDQPPPPNFDSHQQPPPNYHQQPSLNHDYQPPPNLNQPPSSSFGHSPSAAVLGHSPPQIYDQPPAQVYNPPPTIELDHPPSNYDEHPSADFDHPQSSNFDYHSQSNYDNQPPVGYNDQQPPSNFEQHHQSSQIVDIIKEPPLDLDTSKPNHHPDPDHAESRPVYSATSNTILPDTTTIKSERQNHLAPATTSAPPRQRYTQNGPTYQNIYFQRSPLIDLSVAGETKTSTSSTILSSSELSNRFRTTDRPVVTSPSKGEHYDSRESATPSATLIDYIVSGEAFVSSEEVEKETRSPPRLLLKYPKDQVVGSTSTTTTTSTSTTTTRPLDQKQQESHIETLVQSYEFYKKRNDTKSTEEKTSGRLFNDTEDYSASREVVVPSKLDNGKKNKQIIQIIIPYTSQYTPSPFHPTRSANKQSKKDSHRELVPKGQQQDSTTGTQESSESVEDNVVIEESRRVPVTRSPPEQKLRNDSRSQADTLLLAGKMSNTIDVHRLQKNIDNWTIQEYSKATKSVTNSSNSTYPRWLSSKQIPDEYLLSTTELEESNEYYDFSNETKVHRATNKLQVKTSTPESVTKINIINATYPRKPDSNKRLHGSSSADGKSSSADSSERVYVVTPIPNPNSLEDFSYEKDSRSRKRRPTAVKSHNSLESEAEDEDSEDSEDQEENGSSPVERAYQVLPQAVNNLAVLSSAPDSAAPALWGIMEHEEFAANVDQPKWRSEADVLPEPASTPILYAGHSKVSRAR